ncbi:hypothetical protein BBJ28_00020974 [Nothophytophthora sp. Chile5]|nr:hypothetical protein BBJ28_00020974 [Nothophytophthora sp. Chile5]
MVKAKAVKSAPATKHQLVTTNLDGGFDLNSFMASFEPGIARDESTLRAEGLTPSAATSQECTELKAQLQILRGEVKRLSLLLSRQAVGQSENAAALPPHGTPVTPTAQNYKGELPPAEVCYLSTFSFPKGSKKAKTATFWMTTVELMAIFSGRLGSRGLTVMYFKASSEMATLEDSSTNANFSSDFSPSASLTAATIKCDILDALHSLNSLAQKMCNYDAVAAEILKSKRDHPGAPICVMAGNVASAFCNISIRSNSIHLFARHIEEDYVIVIELPPPFDWTSPPGFYEIADGAIAHTHGFQTNELSPADFFTYPWVDDHISVSADIGSSCSDVYRSLRIAIVAVLGTDAINSKKSTAWSTRQRVLGLEFDSVAESVSMPTEKVDKSRQIVAAVYFAVSLSRKAYRSLTVASGT